MAKKLNCKDFIRRLGNGCALVASVEDKCLGLNVLQRVLEEKTEHNGVFELAKLSPGISSGLTEFKWLKVPRSSVPSQQTCELYFCLPTATI